MKKTIPLLLILVTAIICLPSCLDKKRCWSIDSTLSGEKLTKYFWGTESEAVAEIKKMENEESHKDVTKIEERSYTTSKDCLANNH